MRDTRDESLHQLFRTTPREDAAPAGPAVDATVKWFNAEKGFGFVELGDGSGDAFLHIAVLQNAGHDAVAKEAKLRVQVGQGQKDRQVTAVSRSMSAAPDRRRQADAHRQRCHLIAGVPIRARLLKWKVL